MPNQLALANFSGLTAVQNGLDRNAVRIYEREKLIRYSLTLSGVYVQAVRGTAVGEVIDLTKALSPTQFQPNQLWGYRGPVRGYILNGGSSGLNASILPGVDAFHWLLKVFSGGNVGAELAAGAYSAGILADLDIIVEFTGNNFD